MMRVLSLGWGVQSTTIAFPLFVHPARRPLAEAVKVLGDFSMEQLGICEGIAGCGL